MFIYMYIYIYISKYIHIYTYIYIYIYIHIYAHIFIHIYTYIRICTYMCAGLATTLYNATIHLKVDLDEEKQQIQRLKLATGFFVCTTFTHTQKYAIHLKFGLLRGKASKPTPRTDYFFFFGTISTKLCDSPENWTSTRKCNKFIAYSFFLFLFGKISTNIQSCSIYLKVDAGE